MSAQPLAARIDASLLAVIAESIQMERYRSRESAANLQAGVMSLLAWLAVFCVFS
jgi:hypothetical protein